MRVSVVSGQPGLALVGGATDGAASAVVDIAGAGSSALGGTVDAVRPELLELPPNSPGAKCLADRPALRSSTPARSRRDSGVKPPRVVVVVVVIQISPARCVCSEKRQCDPLRAL